MAKAGGKKHCNSSTFSSTTQPELRGVRYAGRKGLIAAMKKSGVTEEGFYELLFKKAMVDEDPLAFKEVMIRLCPVSKPTSPLVEFPFPFDDSFSAQAAAVLNAVSKGVIPADIGSMFVATIKGVIEIEEFTELRSRIESIEESLGVQNV